MREEWITNITHDLKTPLASIKGYSEVIADREYELSEQEQQRYADIIVQKADYIAELVEDLNLAYRLNHPATVVKKRTGNVVEVVRDSIIDVLNHPLYEEASIDFQTEQEYIPLSVDQLLLKRACSNLLYNAIVHNSIEVEIVVHIHVTQGRINIVFADDGKGIEEEELGKLFERYYRGTNTGKAHMGSGLGLAITKQIIEAHDGTIAVKSERGKGTSFLISLK